MFALALAALLSQSPPGCASLEGLVRDAAGAPVRGALVRACEYVSRCDEPVVREVTDNWRMMDATPCHCREAKTRADGRYLIEGLRPGPTRVGAFARGFSDTGPSDALTHLSCEGRSTADRVLERRTG